MSSPIIPWIGGKRRLAPELLPLFLDHTCYVELFAGAAALYFMKRPSQVEIINDINGDLVNLYRVVKHHLEEFVRQFKWCITSRQIYEWMKCTDPATLTDIQRAARFFYIQKLSFGGKVEGQSFGTATTSTPKLNLLRIEEDLSEAHLRLSSTTVENRPWQKIIESYDRPHTLFYADPPYWLTEGYGVPFELEEYEQLAKFAQSIEGTLIISVNDHPEMRRVFADLPMKSVPIRYTVGGNDKAADRAELIIGNWKSGWPKPAAEQQAMFSENERLI